MKKKYDYNSMKGQKFNKVILLAPTTKRNIRGMILWQIQCDCGKTKIVNPYDVVIGKIKSCGCFNANWKREGRKGKAFWRKYSPLESSARAIWRNYCDKDKEMCDFTSFFTLSQQNCYYCGRPPFRTYNAAQSASRGYASNDQKLNGNFTYNGVDRLDNSKSHQLSNLVPCCWDCNSMKKELNLKDFLLLIERIYKNTSQLRSDLPTSQ